MTVTISQSQVGKKSQTETRRRSEQPSDRLSLSHDEMLRLAEESHDNFVMERAKAFRLGLEVKR